MLQTTARAMAGLGWLAYLASLFMPVNRGDFLVGEFPGGLALVMGWLLLFSAEGFFWGVLWLTNALMLLSPTRIWSDRHFLYQRE